MLKWKTNDSNNSKTHIKILKNIKFVLKINNINKIFNYQQRVANFFIKYQTAELHDWLTRK